MLKVEPRAVYADGRVVDVDGFIHLVDGKVIVFQQEGMYNLADPEDLKLFIRLGEDLYVDPLLPKMGGEESVCYLYPPSKRSRFDAKCMTAIYGMRDLKPDLQDRIRRSCDAYDK